MSERGYAINDAETILALADALEAYLRAQSRMLDDWAEGDEAVKQSLWRALHDCELPAREILDRVRP